MKSLKYANKTKAFFFPSKIYNSTVLADLISIYWKMQKEDPEEKLCTL